MLTRMLLRERMLQDAFSCRAAAALLRCRLPRRYAGGACSVLSALQLPLRFHDTPPFAMPMLP